MNESTYYFYVLFVSMRQKLSVLFLLAIYTCPARAQLGDAAQRNYNKAMDLMAHKDKEGAYAHMQQAIKDNSSFADAYSALGEWYFKAHKFKEAVDVFGQASRSCQNGAKAFALPLAKSLLHNYSPEQALQLVAAYGTMKEKSQWVLLREQAYFMKQELAQRHMDSAVNLGIRINSQDPEMFPCLTADTLNLFFTRRVNGVDEDFYKSHADSCGGWFTARNMGSPPNSKHFESSQYISGDGHYLFFMRCDNRSENGWDQGGCDLYMAYTGDSVWSTPENFGATINTPAFEGMPALSPDNRELYFVSDRPGGFGGLDIWVSKFDNGLWQAPRNLGPLINTAGNETAPFIHIDNNTLYFASDALPGMGGNDIYYCRRINDTTWSKPQNMGYPYNTSSDENSICVTIDGTRAYLASDRDSTSGNFDIYQVAMDKEHQPVPVAIIKGYTYDSLNKQRLTYSSIYINDPKTGEPAYQFKSNRGDASYMITLPTGYKYSYNVDRIGYLNTSGTIDLTDKHNIEQMAFNMPLLPQDYVEPVNDSNVAVIYFPINCKTISDSNKAKIQAALTPWLDQKSVVIFINGYTDNSGNPLLNEELSYLRATLVSNEISSMGIDPGNIQAKGWGEANPIAPNDAPENMNLNRRVEVIIRR
jgi:outer membrane protein OmpA-like peptidoglycan-associated protein